MLLLLLACTAPKDALVDTGHEDDVAPACDLEEHGTTVAVMYYPDLDGDTYGDADGGVASCTRPAGWLTNGDDCDDTSAAIKPGGTEVCDAADADEDCDGLVDDEDPTVTGTIGLLPDGDGDGFGDETATSIQVCDPGAGYATTRGDCDDTDDTISPDAEEVCADGIDNDCDDASYPCGINGEWRWWDGPRTTIETTGYIGYELDAGDFDGDGFGDLAYRDSTANEVDLFFGPLAASTSYDDAEADVTFSPSWSSVDSFGSYLVGIGDRDLDGDDDLVVVQEDYESSPRHVAWLVNGSPTLASSTLTTMLTTSDSSYLSAGAAGDFDGDGYPDAYTSSINVTSTPDALTVWRHDTSTTWTHVEGELGRNAPSRPSDFDGDGLDDLLIEIAGVPSGNAMVAILGDESPVGGAIDIASDAWVLETWLYYACAPGDLDGDGYDDAGIVTASSGFYLFQGPPSLGLTTAGAFASGFGGENGCLGADTDGDGQNELFAQGAGGFVSRYASPIGSGALTTTEATIEGVPYVMRTGEITGDDYDDLLFGGSPVWVLPGGEW